MDITTYTRKDVGNLGERVTAYYLKSFGHIIVGRNIFYKVGELDIVSQKDSVLHVTEVKTSLCESFSNCLQRYNPGDNLHLHKITKLVRAANMYMVKNNWVGEWQIDAALVLVRRSDGMAKVHYIPQIL